MLLNDAQKGQGIEIINIPDADIRAQAIRWGFSEGSHLFCTENIKNGPVILRNMRQEIAVGYALASHISVKPLMDHCPGNAANISERGGLFIICDE